MIELNYKLSININNFVIKDTNFSFDYIVKINEKEKEGSYEDQHNWENVAAFEKLLLKGHALNLVLEEISN